MNKYNEVEIQTAKNLLKQGYKWIVRENYGKVYAYTDKPRKNHDWNKCADTWWDDAHPDSYLFICTEDIPIFQSVTCDDKEPTSLGSIAYPQILEDDEKKNDDLISRAEAIDAINKAFERVFAWDGTSPLGDKVLENVPSAQPENIYCRECKHWLDIDDGRQKHRMCADVYGDWFCGDAERRTNEQDD